LKLASTVLLKIDTQGFEKNVLLGGEGTLPQIKIIIVETSFAELYLDSRVSGNLSLAGRARLRVSRKLGPSTIPRDGMPIQQDGIFIRI
jgi:hypothetical protein